MSWKENLIQSPSKGRQVRTQSKRTVLRSTRGRWTESGLPKKRGSHRVYGPDFPGKRIRSIIEERIPGVKHVFLRKSKTIAKNGQGLGIEHAKDEDIIKALEAVY